MKRRNTGTGMMVAALLAMLPLAGCYEHTVTVGGGAPHGPVVYDHWENFWLAGLIGHKKVDVEALCGSRPATIEAKQTFLNGLVGALTSGIYTPTTVKVRCADGRSSRLDLDEEDVARIVADPGFVLWVSAELPERAAEVAEAQAALVDR